MSATEDILEQAKSFSDQELREKLTSMGMDVGPITGTTRSLYERKLVQLLTGARSEFNDGSSHTPPKSPRKSIRTARVSEPTPIYDSTDGIRGEDPVTSSSYQPLNDSTINLIRPRKPVSRVVNEEPVLRKSASRQNTPFIAANAQYRRNESSGSFADHLMKFALFGVVMLVIVYFISSQEAGNALDHRK